jgi:hypothetical protein
MFNITSSLEQVPPPSQQANSNLRGQILSQLIAGKVQAVYRRSVSCCLDMWDNSMIDLEAFRGAEIQILVAQSG